MYKPLTKFILEVGKAGLSFEELACIAGVSQINLFKFLAGKIELGSGQLRTLAEIIGKEPEELFPGVD